MLRMKDYLDFLKEKYPDEVLVVDEEVNPAAFEVTAILRHLELAGKYPLVYFSHPLNLEGEVSEFPLITNEKLTDRAASPPFMTPLSNTLRPSA